MKRVLAVTAVGAALTTFPLLASVAQASPHCPPLLPPALCGGGGGGGGGQPWQLPQNQNPAPQHPLFPQNPLIPHPQNPFSPQNPVPPQNPIPQHPLLPENPPAPPQNPAPAAPQNPIPQHPQHSPNPPINEPEGPPVTPEPKAPPRPPEESGPTPPLAPPHGENTPPSAPVPHGENTPPSAPVPHGENTPPSAPVPHTPQAVPHEPTPPSAGPHGPSAPPNAGGSNAPRPSGAPAHEPGGPGGPGHSENTPIKLPPPTTPKVAPIPQQRVEAARTAPPVMVNALAPPPPPHSVNFDDQVKTVVKTNSDNITTVNVNNVTVVKPAKWQYLDYENGNPVFYNPYTGPVNVKYFAGGAYRFLAVAAGARMVLDGIAAAAYPFTVLGEDFISAGYFNGGGYVPEVYDNVDAYLPNYDQSVLVDRVTYLGHDDGAPAGQQDRFMLNGTTMAEGTKKDDGHIDLQQVQQTPGVGPTDDGGSLLPVQLAVKESDSTWPWVAGGAGAAGLATVGSVGWMLRRRRNGYGKTEVI